MSFPAFATFIMQATLLLGMAVMLRRILRRRIPAAARYRMIFVVTACLPLLAGATVFEVRPSVRSVAAEPRSFDIRAFSADIAPLPPGSGRRTLPIQVPEKIADTLLAAWAAIGVVLVCRSLSARMMIALALRRMKACRDPAWLAALDSAAARHDIGHGIRLLDGGEHPPFTAGLLGRTIVVPTADECLSAKQREAILLHEAAHVKRGDVLRMAYVDLVAAATWCVPFMSHAVRALIEDREEACDVLAIEKGAKPSDYASVVLELTAARPLPPPLGALGMVGRTRTEARIRRIMNRDARRTENRYIGRFALAAILLAGFSLGGTGMLSRVFALESAGTAGVRTISADGHTGRSEYSLALLPKSSPLAGSWRVTQPFGKQTNPITGVPYLHVGIDLANGRSGDPVLSTIAGTVIQAAYDDRGGNTLAIGDDRLLVRFSKLQDMRVAVGDRVRIGTEIGTVGATGVATGPHLHYEVWVEGTAVDPAVLLKAGGATFAGLGVE